MRELRQHRRLGALRLSYTIAGGDRDADRLARQAEVMDSATGSFLRRIGVAPGWRCLDVGCGQGQVTMVMAHMVEPGGAAVGVDVDAGALAGARRSVAQAEFRRVDVTTRSLGEAEFDLAYARLLLSHLVEPAAVLRSMGAAVRPGGTVAVEDLLTGTLHSEPRRPVLDEFQELYAATVRRAGGDPTIGPRMRAMFESCGLAEVAEESVVNPMTSVEEKLFIPESLRNMRASILSVGLATSDEIDEMADRLEAAACEPSTTFYQARIYQVSGRRPAEVTPGG